MSRPRKCVGPAANAAFTGDLDTGEKNRLGQGAIDWTRVTFEKMTGSLIPDKLASRGQHQTEARDS